MALKLSFGLLALATFASAANFRRVACPDGVHTATNEACCVFHSLADHLQTITFNFTCGEDAHEALRLTFHDAIGFSFMNEALGGGADGSIMIFEDTELMDPANNGVDDAIDNLRPLLTMFDISAGDLIQFAGAVAVSNCPGAPKLEFMAGRPNATHPAALGLVPKPEDPVDMIFARMEDAGFSPTELVGLLASHSIARSDTLIDNRQAVPFDSTPFTFDTQIFLEVLLAGQESQTLPAAAGEVAAQVPNPLVAQGEMRLQSDFAIAHSTESNCFWQSLVNDQNNMMIHFHDAMAKLAVVGQDTSKMIDCSEAIPEPVPPVAKPATFPAGTGPELLQLSCTENIPFPSLATDPGQATTIPECPDGDINLNDCPS
ncbi:manganese peroxidase 2 [Schizopora paradoxa]|uniref:Peroxidase n=1 Tax=Schizopora paradoxa TaxID=27342 RepID=A0A0H2RA10_9AGAM|nr:manganese peroxidase 2 [Schizopora paradoxa]